MRPFPGILLATLAVAAALGLAACGDDDETGATAAGDGQVSTATIDDSTVLVDAEGRALYTSDREEGEVACTGGCAAVWPPAEAEGGEVPTVDGVELDVTERPDGTSQLTLDGRPLYSFTEEGAGELTGDGLTDSFGGREFTWSAAVVESPDAAAEDSDSDQPAGGY